MQKWTVKLSFKSHECHSTLPLIKLPDDDDTTIYKAP